MNLRATHGVERQVDYLSDEARTTAVGNIQHEVQQRRNEKALYLMSGINALNAANENARRLDDVPYPEPAA
ncbi:MAG: hypothetical protein ACR65U_07720 [Methylocystis sp.]